jgi:hypothetical protein
MARERSLQPVNPIHPSEMLLREFLVPDGKTRTAFTRQIGWTRARLWMNLRATHEVDAAGRKWRVT